MVEGGQFVNQITNKTISEDFLRMAEAGNIPCFSDASGSVDTRSLCHGNTGFAVKGANLILAKAYLAEKGIENPTAITTFNQANQRGATVKGGEKGFTLPMYSPERVHAETGVKEPASVKNVRYFEVRQTTKPEGFVKQRELAGKEKVIEAKSGEPVQYLADYLTAVASGARFTVSPTVAEQAKANITKEIKQEMATGKYSKLFTLCGQASVKCREQLKEVLKTKEVPSNALTKDKPSQRISRTPDVSI